MSIANATILPAAFSQWLDDNAQGLDLGSEVAPRLLPMIAEAGLFKIGVAARFGGTDGDVADATRAIAAVSARSLAAGLVFWGHRTFIEYLMQTRNDALRERALAGVVSRTAGRCNRSVERDEIRQRH